MHAYSFPGKVAELAREAEQWGFAGLLIADSQNLTADIWVELALAGAATSRLRLGPGVTNPLTRHLAVTASAAATLQAETGGRSTLGFGQGDSALGQIGCSRLSVRNFEYALQTLQGFLRGEEVQLDRTISTIRWLTTGELEKVPVHVAATGPRTIAAAARHAEGVDLTVGAAPERLSWGIGVARDAAPRDISLGAYVNIAVDPDRSRARELVRGRVATFARFSAEAPSAGGLSAAAKQVVARAESGYRRERHGEAAASFAQELDDEFIDQFAVAAPAAEVRERLAGISALGIDRLIVTTGSLDADREAVAQSNERFARDVLPALVD